MISNPARDAGEQPTANKGMFEQHFTPAQISKMWGLSDECVRNLFRNEEGVIIINRPEKMHKRGYSTMRIPASVAERVYARLVLKKRPTSIAAGPVAAAAAGRLA